VIFQYDPMMVVHVVDTAFGAGNLGGPLEAQREAPFVDGDDA